MQGGIGNSHVHAVNACEKPPNLLEGLGKNCLIVSVQYLYLVLINGKMVLINGKMVHVSNKFCSSYLKIKG